MKISEKGKIEEILYAYAEKNETAVDEEKIRETVQKVQGSVFLQVKRRGRLLYGIHFPAEQIYKKDMVAASAYRSCCTLCMPVHVPEANIRCSAPWERQAPLLVIMIVPELWKNRGSMSMEIEGSAYYSLRQVYSARLTVFAFADGILLTLFSVFAFATTRIEAEEMMVQFMLPMIVTCCICLRMLCSRFVSSEYMAVFLSLLWTGFWLVVVIDRGIYDKIIRACMGGHMRACDGVISSMLSGRR